MRRLPNMALRFAILISGRGSNMLALSDMFAVHGAKCELALVAADNNCAGLALAKERGIATALCPYQGRTKAQSEAELIAKIEEAGADFILLAGFMRILSADFVAHFEGRIINIHPSLLPKYKGLDTHQKALNAKDERHGVTVHLVTAGLDEGPIIAQAAIPILAHDDEQTLSERLLPVEHALYSTVIEALITGDLRARKGEFSWQCIPQLPVKAGELLIPS